jgi:5-methylcytosine-specific restriction endonuclease McrA
MNSQLPENLEKVSPSVRIFPASWKDAAIRELYDEAMGGVVCPICKKILRGRKELKTLQADHIIPWTKGGLTDWENLQLLCSGCNILKSNIL